MKLKLKKCLALLTVFLLMLSLSACLEGKEQKNKDKDNKCTEEKNNTKEISANKVLEESIAALEKADSLHLSQETSSSYTISNNSVKLSTSVESDIDIKNGLLSHDMKTNQNGQEVNMQMYVESQNSKSNIYMSSNNVWLKQTGIDSSDIYRLGSGLNGIEHIQFYLKAIEASYLDSESDEDNYIISGIIPSDDSEEILEKNGFLTIIEQLDSSGELSDSDRQSLISNLAPIDLVIYINKDTMLLSKLEFDITKLTDSIYKNLNKIAGGIFAYTISENKGIIMFSDYNDISDIIIPNEALSGTEYKLVPQNS